MPVEMILKVTKREEIGSVTLPSTPKFELHPVQNGFGASIVVVKKGVWRKSGEQMTKTMCIIVICLLCKL